MKISVITVCYNSEATIGLTLQSVASQTWPWVEHIVIDGGSTDGTCEVVDQYRPRLAQFVSEPDDGIYDAMNKGLRLATGDVVCFLNSDDYYSSDNTLSLVATQLAKKNLDALFGDVSFFKPGAPCRAIRYYRSGSFNPRRLGWGWMPAHPALFMRREIYQNLNGFKSDYRIAGDFEFVARAFTTCQLRYEYVPEVLVEMQIGGTSTASGIKGRILHNKELLRACRENGIATNVFKILSRYPLKARELLVRR